MRAGVVGRPHGLDGSFHVGEPVAELLTAGAEVRIGEHIRRVDRLAGHGRRPIMRLEGCTQRSAAEALRGQEIRVAREEAPRLGPDEWWAADLEGCAVLDGDESVGVVTRLLELPSCEVLEVTRDGERAALLVPLIRDAVRAVDVERRVIDVDLRFLGER
ncbi:MAG: ribosome maturation factor RimM [Solirubrobacteraceae bacterium]